MPRTTPVARTRLITALVVPLLAGSIIWAIKSLDFNLLDGEPKSPESSGTPSERHTADNKSDTPPTHVPSDPVSEIGDEEINTSKIMNLPDCKDASPGSVDWDMNLNPNPPLLGRKTTFETSWTRKKGEACRFNLGRDSARLTASVHVTYKDFPERSDWIDIWKSSDCADAPPRWARLDISHPLAIAYHWNFGQTSRGCNPINTFKQPGYTYRYSIEAPSFPGLNKSMRASFVVK